MKYEAKSEYPTVGKQNEINFDSLSKYFAKNDLFRIVERGNDDEASKLFADNKQVLNECARNANGLTVTEVAMKGNHWNIVEWLLDNGFACEGVGKRVYGNGRYVGELNMVKGGTHLLMVLFMGETGRIITNMVKGGSHRQMAKLMIGTGSMAKVGTHG